MMDQWMEEDIFVRGRHQTCAKTTNAFPSSYNQMHAPFFVAFLVSNFGPTIQSCIIVQAKKNRYHLLLLNGKQCSLQKKKWEFDNIFNKACRIENLLYHCGLEKLNIYKIMKNILIKIMKLK
jgi:hypothetical protein